ncbi:NADP-dependent oxidoreductase domain-containing protein [Lipomyces starkeyi]
MSGIHKSSVNVVFGAMTIGKPGLEGIRVNTLEDTAAILDVFQQHGHTEVDTARVYGQGSSEEYLGNVQWQTRGHRMDTKLCPTASRNMSKITPEVYSHRPEDLREGLKRSLEALIAQICEICDKHGWIKPSVYHGIYHALQRSIELELFPCLRHYGMSI